MLRPRFACPPQADGSEPVGKGRQSGQWFCRAHFLDPECIPAHPTTATSESPGGPSLLGALSSHLGFAESAWMFF